MARCPSCFTWLDPDVAAWVCTARCSSGDDDVASDFAGFPVSNKPITWQRRPPQQRGFEFPPSIPCRLCGMQTSTRVCPTCHYGPLPADWMSSLTTCIAMAGARFTGKSFYICVGFKQLQHLGNRLGRTVDFADNRTKATYTTHYERPVFENRGLIPPTPRHDTDNPPQRYPLIFSLGLVGQRRHYLVIRDVAGEDLEQEIPNQKHLQFLANADSVFFLFDPNAVPSITDMFPGLEDKQESGADPLIVLNNVLRLIGNGRPRLAVVLAKFDTLEKLRSVQRTLWSEIMSHTGAAMLRDPSLTSKDYDDIDGQLLHEEIRSMLAKLNAAPLLTALERPTNGNRLDHRFFAVSVLGESPRNDRLTTRGIAPFRCLDPLRWAMAGTAAQ